MVTTRYKTTKVLGAWLRTPLEYECVRFDVTATSPDSCPGDAGLESRPRHWRLSRFKFVMVFLNPSKEIYV
jgi:hypothetical protein